jgi:hypothetical protein
MTLLDATCFRGKTPPPPRLGHLEVDTAASILHGVKIVQIHNITKKPAKIYVLTPCKILAAVSPYSSDLRGRRRTRAWSANSKIVR